MDNAEMKIHSDVAWEIASHYSYTLASDTRTLAAQIDEALKAEREKCAKIAESVPNLSHPSAYADAIRKDTPNDQ